MTEEQGPGPSAPIERPRPTNVPTTVGQPGRRPEPEMVLATSPQVGEIVAALAKAQALYVSVPKTKTAKIVMRGDRGSYDYNYADLADVLDMVRPRLSAQGIAIVQASAVLPGSSNPHGVVETRLMLGEQWLGCTLRLPLGDTSPQTYGSLMTYLRRYGLQSLAGVSAEVDDDGGAERQTPPAGRGRTSPARELRNELPDPEVNAQARAAQPPKAEKPKAEKPKAAKPATSLGAPGTISATDRSNLFQRARAVGWQEADVKSLLKQLFNYDSTSQIKAGEEFAQVMACIERPGDNGVSFETIEGQQVLVLRRPE